MNTAKLLVLLAALSPAMPATRGFAAGADQPPPPAANADPKDDITDGKVAIADSWETIKGSTYEQRDDFAGALKRMVGKLETDLAELNAKVASLPDAAAKNRERALKEFGEARGFLETLLSHVHTCTGETWESAKEELARSWQNLQAAFTKIKASPTS